MSDVGSTSVRRASDKVELLDALLRSKDGGAFSTYRDALVFAAAVGWRHRRKVPVEGQSGPIDWGTMINRFGTEQLVDVVAYEDSGDVDILSPVRLPERVRIFEAYANGGLEVIQEHMSQGALSAGEAVYKLLRGQLDEQRRDESEGPDLKDLGKALGL